MTDDTNHQPAENEAEFDEAAEAFASLRQTVEIQGQHLGAEITVVRRGVEAAFEQFEKFQQPADYAEDLATMAEGIAHVVERVQAIEKSPILKNGPEYYARILERSAESAMRIPVTQFENQTRDLQRMTRQLEDQFEGARERRQQNRYMAYVGGAAFVAGILAVLLFPRLFPNSLAPRVASLVMAVSPWQAGMDMLTWASPESVGRVASADQLVRANKDEIAACTDAAKKAGKDQKCTITVAAPSP
jgi:hypothetical protein